MSERGRTGRVVGGRFELLARLGSGGMGTVWRARDLGLHREVAIKEVRPADAALYENDPSLAAQQRERVLRESRALARLQHPNVVSIYQILESEDSPYPWIVMELVRGTSLDARLREGALSPAEAARIGRDVLGALRAAHAAGILHRDVKPGNVLLRTDGGAVLTDFGIAALHDSTTLTATGEVIGSPEYIAPERLHGDETQTSSDLWSLALLLSRTLGSKDDPSTDAGSDSPGTQVATLPKVDVPDTPPTTATTLAPPEDLPTPAGTRKAVAALTKVMGGSKVSELNVYSDHAAATAPAEAVKNGYDDFEYRNGTATRTGPDTVDDDITLVDLDNVNWDALPSLWKRAERELGIDKPTLRYLIVDTGLIDHVPSLRLYLADDYGGAYLGATLAGKVVTVVPRG
jgi:serine/threonine protein kinase